MLCKWPSMHFLFLISFNIIKFKLLESNSFNANWTWWYWKINVSACWKFYDVVINFIWIFQSHESNWEFKRIFKLLETILIMKWKILMGNFIINEHNLLELTLISIYDNLIHYATLTSGLITLISTRISRALSISGCSHFIITFHFCCHSSIVTAEWTNALEQIQLTSNLWFTILRQQNISFKSWTWCDGTHQSLNFISGHKTLFNVAIQERKKIWARYVA